MVLKIRQIEINDWKDIKKLYNEWRTENTFAVPEVILSNGQAKKRTTQLIEDGINFAGELNGRVVGLIESSIGKLPKTNHTLYVSQLNVLKDYRRNGIASKLLKKLLSVAKQKKIKLIYLNIVSTNKPAIRLYEKLGFKKTGCVKKQYKFGNKYVDNCIMCKFLGQTLDS
ncbi:MAG: GNAT family N-acetyltransferase [Candidatus ainarchaeum sp.]|nr:GNAT family N-acetyltransferase [Candidatus ainarchaeum sp.]